MGRYEMAIGDITFEESKPQNFTAVREFALNFDDRKIKSIKIRVGDTISYNGETVSYTKPTGEPVMGKVSSLKSVINRAKWLVLAGTGKKAKAPAIPAVEKPAPTDFEPKRGGNFNSFLEIEKNVKVEKPAKPQSIVIKEEDRIVKTTTGKKEPQKHLEVSRDQVDVRQVGGERYSVNSSTSAKGLTKEARQAPTITQAEDMGAVKTFPITYKKEASSKDPKKRNAFMVDEHTPSLPQEPSLEDIQRIKRPFKVENQEATVVSKISKPKMLDVQEVDGQEIDGVTLKKIAGPKEMSIKTTVGSGSTPIGDASDGVVVAQTTSMTEKPPLTASKVAEAKAKAEERKRKSAQTQAHIETEKKIKTASAPAPAPASDKVNYMSMLPDDWGLKHWVQKEQFIKALTDIEFIKFILSVESTKAVLNACEERLKELA